MRSETALHGVDFVVSCEGRVFTLEDLTSDELQLRRNPQICGSQSHLQVPVINHVLKERNSSLQRAYRQVHVGCEAVAIGTTTKERMSAVKEGHTISGGYCGEAQIEDVCTNLFYSLTHGLAK